MTASHDAAHAVRWHASRWPPRPHYRLEVRRTVMHRTFDVPLILWSWRVRDADGWVTDWYITPREACEQMRAGCVL